jgi:hypothetical protein
VENVLESKPTGFAGCEGFAKWRDVFDDEPVRFILVAPNDHSGGKVNAANCMLDFINNYFMLFTTYVSLFIESHIDKAISSKHQQLMVARVNSKFAVEHSTSSASLTNSSQINFGSSRIGYSVSPAPLRRRVWNGGPARMQ